MKVREKVATAVRATIAALEPHKAAIKRLPAASPANLSATAPEGLWTGADAIWAGLGDKSTDYNWYTKRMILTGVIGSTVVAWLGSCGLPLRWRLQRQPRRDPASVSGDTPHGHADL